MMPRPCASRDPAITTQRYPERPVDLFASCSADIMRHVQEAQRRGQSLHPISAGRNWGYGGATPIASECCVLDLSGMKQIEILDRELGLVSVEPGVTQADLVKFLSDSDCPLLVPVHGGGPDCSLLGNALERGYGLTPETDHFGALRSIEAVLADGTTYRSPFAAMGLERVGASHRWGIGPFVDGLFSQGNIGIVTKGTFALAPRPEHVEAFFIKINSFDILDEVVERLREILAGLGSLVGGVNLMNERRVLSMTRPYPIDQVSTNDIIPDELCRQLISHAGIPAWTGAGVIHCPKGMVVAIRKEICRKMPKSVGWPIFLNRRRTELLANAARTLPFLAGSLRQQIGSIQDFIDIANGIPSRIALRLAYWLSGKKVDKNDALDLARDNCGIIWYSPLVPMVGKDVLGYCEMVDRICRRFAIEPLITLTSLSHRLFDSTVPILYRSEVPGAEERARACYDALFDAGKEMGFFPYRVGTRTMEKLTGMDDGTHWSVVERIKKALDPNDIIAPGRYCPTERAYL